MDGWFGSLFMAFLGGPFLDCFVDIVYVTLGLDDQGYCCLVLNNMLSSSCVIKC